MAGDEMALRSSLSEPSGGAPASRSSLHLECESNLTRDKTQSSVILKEVALTSETDFMFISS